MSYGTYAITESITFTVTHARHIAIKIGTDLKRMQRFYGKPSDNSIEDYENEAIALLLGDYLDKVEYGFKTSNNEWRVALKYEARSGGVLSTDDSPGRIRPSVNVNGCHFTSFLITNSKWARLSPESQEKVYQNAGVSFRRIEGKEPYGNWARDKTYSAGGRGVVRSSLA